VHSAVLQGLITSLSTMIVGSARHLGLPAICTPTQDILDGLQASARLPLPYTFRTLSLTSPTGNTCCHAAMHPGTHTTIHRQPHTHTHTHTHSCTQPAWTSTHNLTHSPHVWRQDPQSPHRGKKECGTATFLSGLGIRRWTSSTSILRAL
jgi:hypothetical protein